MMEFLIIVQLMIVVFSLDGIRRILLRIEKAVGGKGEE